MKSSIYLHLIILVDGIKQFIAMISYPFIYYNYLFDLFYPLNYHVTKFDISIVQMKNKIIYFLLFMKTTLYYFFSYLIIFKLYHHTIKISYYYY